jgi:hypothetical protein
MLTNTRRNCARSKLEGGFSLFELLVAVGMLMVIVGSALAAVSFYQRNYVKTELLTDMHSGVRGAVELMTQEISQAGLINSLDAVAANIDATFSLDATGNATIAQTVKVNNSAIFYPNEEVQVDTGNNQETVVIQSIVDSTHLSGIFTKTHLPGAPIYAIGVIAEGVVPPDKYGTYDPTICCDVLQIIGDVNANGTLQMVEYKCDWAFVDNTGNTIWALTRSETPISAATKSAAVPLVKGIQKNPIPAGGTVATPCFNFKLQNVSVTRTNGAALSYWYTTNISLTLTAQTSKADPQTNQVLTMTKSFLDISPRNVNGAFQLAQTSEPGRILARPSGTPSWLPNPSQQ